MSSVHFELPPSTIVSPFSSSLASLSTVPCVGSPAGTMIHTVRGASSFFTRSASDRAPTAPRLAAASMFDWLWSNATTSCSESRLMRATMLPPIRPRPTKPICAMGLQVLLDRAQRRDRVAAEHEALRRQPMVAQDQQVAVRLRALEGLEGGGLARDREVVVGDVQQLQEAADRRSALVQLAGRVQVARPVAEGRGHGRAVADQ